ENHRIGSPRRGGGERVGRAGEVRRGTRGCGTRGQLGDAQRRKVMVYGELEEVGFVTEGRWLDERHRSGCHRNCGTDDDRDSGGKPGEPARSCRDPAGRKRDADEFASAVRDNAWRTSEALLQRARSDGRRPCSASAISAPDDGRGRCATPGGTDTCATATR